MTALATPSQKLVLGTPAIAACVAHAQALGVGLLADDHAILRAAARPNGGLFAAFPGGIGGYFRPVTMASLALVDAVAPGSALAQHAFGLAVHALTAGLVAAVARRLAGDGVLALGLGVLYAVHPAHAATVSWIAARGDLLATLGTVAAIALAWRGTRLATAGAALAAVLAIGAKESAYALALLLPIAGELAAGAPTASASNGAGAPDPRALRASARGVALVACAVAIAHALAARVAFGGSQRALAGLRSPLEALTALVGAFARMIAPGPIARALAAAAQQAEPRWIALGAVALLVVFAGAAYAVARGPWRRALEARRTLALALGLGVASVAPIAALGGADDRLLGTPLVVMVIAIALLPSSRPAARGLARTQQAAFGALALVLGGLALAAGAEWRAASRLAERHAQSLNALRQADPRRPIVVLTYPTRLGGALVFSDDASSALGDDVVALGPIALTCAADLDAAASIARAGSSVVEVHAAFDLRGVAADESARVGELTVRALAVSPRAGLLGYELTWPQGREPLLLRARAGGFEPVGAPH